VCVDANDPGDEITVNSNKMLTGASLDLFEWGGVSSFCRVIKANFAESLLSIINISFPKIVGKGKVQ
jgi:hypothetical protein